MPALAITLWDKKCFLSRGGNTITHYTTTLLHAVHCTVLVQYSVQYMSTCFLVTHIKNKRHHFCSPISSTLSTTVVVTCYIYICNCSATLTVLSKVDKQMVSSSGNSYSKRKKAIWPTFAPRGTHQWGHFMGLCFIIRVLITSWNFYSEYLPHIWFRNPELTK